MGTTAWMQEVEQRMELLPRGVAETHRQAMVSRRLNRLLLVCYPSYHAIHDPYLSR